MFTLPSMPLVTVTVPPAIVTLAQSALAAAEMIRLAVKVPPLMVRLARPTAASPLKLTLELTARVGFET